MKAMTSRERVCAALKKQDVDYVPCSPFFNPLNSSLRVGYKWQWPFGPSVEERADYCVKNLEIDLLVPMFGGQTFPDESVSFKVWIEDSLIHKVYETPSGSLKATVKYDEKWPYGLDIPFYHDFIAHYTKPWLQTQQDLDCLKHILKPAWKKEHLDQIRFFANEGKRLAQKYHLPTCSDVGMGLTGAQQLIGATEICLMTIENPDLLNGYLEIEHENNLKNIEIAVDMGADLIRRNGFYETCDFYSPDMLERFLGKRLRKETQTMNEAGVVSGYTVHTGVMPMLDYLSTLGFDCIMHLDTAFEGVDLKKIYEKLGAEHSFIIGPSNTYHMWADDPEVVRQIVRDVFNVFGKRGMSIAPAPSIHSIHPWQNTLAMIDEWQKLR